ncbi:MAG: hypothetical protein AAFY28_19195, partial [Actinomycetota bacterium]
MATGRPQSLVSTCDQWMRATHDGTALEMASGDLMLSWTDPEAEEPSGDCTPGRGRTVDRMCRVYAAYPDRIDRIAVGETDGTVDYHAQPPPVTVIGEDPAAPGARLTGATFMSSAPPSLVDATGLAIDEGDRLYVGDRGRSTISVIDLWSRRLLRTVQVATPLSPDRHPVALTSVGSEVVALVDRPLGIIRFSAWRGPVEEPLPDALADAPNPTTAVSIAALPSGRPVLLVADAQGSGWLVADGVPAHEVGPATGIVVDVDGTVVVAPCPSSGRRLALRRWSPGPTWEKALPL